MQGSDLEEKFVTSYQVLFSENGNSFSYILDDQKQPQLFRGPVDEFKPVEQKFYEPIEAKVIRINPLSWHNGIAMKVELLGCQDLTISTTESVPIITTVLTEETVKPSKIKVDGIKLLEEIISLFHFHFQCVTSQWVWTMI